MEKIKNGTILLYDEKEYEIEEIPSSLLWFKEVRNVFKLKRVSDGVVLQTFIGNFSKIIEIKKDECNHFLSIDNDYKKCIVKHEKDLRKDWLELVGIYNCNSCTQIYDDLFYLDMGEDNIHLYNLRELSKPFSEIYTDKDICELMGKNVILVSEKKKSEYDKNVIDTITYGINPNTYEIVTPIWSDLQQRNINIQNASNQLKDEIIKKEIQAPLDDKAKNMKSGLSVYTSTGEINKEFVKRFKN